MVYFKFRRCIQKASRVQGKELLFLTFVMMLCLVTIVFGGQKRQESGLHYESVYIHSGDTLWSIAKSYSTENDTTEHMIQEIMKLNGMCSQNIRSGDKLIVPVKRFE